MMMITITEYNAHVQELKTQFQEKYGKIKNPKKVAIVTVGMYLEKFIIILRALLMTVGVDAHWYHYSGAEDLDIELEIKDLREHYDEVTVFRSSVGNNTGFALAAFKSIMDLVEPVAGKTFCVLGQDAILVNGIAWRLFEQGVDFVISPNGKRKRADCILLLDDKTLLAEKYIDTPVIELFSWNSINEQAYNLSEEIAIRMGGYLLDR